MASYVLDTHACLYALAAPKKLGRGAKRALQRAERIDEDIWIPAAVVAEIVLLRELGRTEIGLPALKEVFDGSRTWKLLPLDFAQLDAFALFSSIRDPFDRLIVSAARALGAKLVSKDSALEELGTIDVVWG